MALTEAALKALKPRDTPYTPADERGLYVEAFPTGGLVWRFRYRLNGEQEKLEMRRLPSQYTKALRAEKMARAYAHVYDHYAVQGGVREAGLVDV
jgi:hypothetical protein